MTADKKTPKKRGPKTGARGRPVNPARIKRIVDLRDNNGWTFSRIAQSIGDDPPQTEQSIYLAYTRWRDWAKKQKTRGATPLS